MIAIVDYGAGNIRSVVNALKRSLGSARDDSRVISTEAARPSGEISQILLTADPAVLRAADKVILPGVGEASTAMKALQECGLADVIPTLKQPVLGICVGAQLMCAGSEEGDTRCMGIFPAEVRRFKQTATEKVPHMGWNSLRILSCPLSNWNNLRPLSCRPSKACGDISNETTPTMIPSPLFTGLKDGDYVYFVHSYYPEVCADTIATATHGVEFSAALARDNFFACQFHPEKSGTTGEQILKNFLSL
ncbi:MAG: imidazole glycerol phosphate synthase subunit HisH [Bacteroidales bacterium]|nr:imidazole glycerol phosphate synthase subunit HisH [Bacteroidales bacterium]